MSNAKYVLATQALQRKLISESKAWVEESNQYNSCKGTVIYAVAEYRANLQGFTLYTNKATYPKKIEEV